MKIIISSLLILLVSCSSSDKKKTTTDIEVSNADFKKEAPLKNSEVKDFYVGNQKTINPALSDETIDRLTVGEMKEVNVSGDPLLQIAILCGTNKAEEGLGVASRYFNRYQKVAQYWNLIGNCHLKQGSRRKALLFYNKTLEIDANYVPALNNIGVMYLQQGEFQKALVAFERANKKSKFAKTPRYNLAKLYLMYGLADSALPLFQSLLSLAPQDVDLLNAVASAHFLLGNYDKALGYYQQIPKDMLERPEIGLNYAMTLSRSGNKRDALNVFEAVKQPRSGELKGYYSVVKSRLGE